MPCGRSVFLLGGSLSHDTESPEMPPIIPEQVPPNLPETHPEIQKGPRNYICMYISHVLKYK